MIHTHSMITIELRLFMVYYMSVWCFSQYPFVTTFHYINLRVDDSKRALNLYIEINFQSQSGRLLYFQSRFFFWLHCE
jgi:hypothetical protein